MSQSRRFTATIAALLLALGATFPSDICAQKSGASPAQGQVAGGAAGQTGGGSTPYFETQMLAYGGANQLSEAVAQEVCKSIDPTTQPTVVIFDQTSFQNLQAWQSFVTSALVLEKAYGTLLQPQVVSRVLPPPPSHGPFLSLFPITSGSDFASLVTALASSTTNTASAFTIPDSAMAVSLAHQFPRVKDCAQVNLIYYPLFGSYVDPKDAGNKVTSVLANINKLRNYIQLNVTFSSNNDPRFLLYTDLNNQYDQLLKSISSSSGSGQGAQSAGGQSTPGGASGAGSPTTSASTSTGSSTGSTSLIQGAELNDLLMQDNTYILYADVVAAGGTQRDRKNIITLLTGDWISYSGGLIVNVALINSSDTSLIFSDTLRYRTGNHHLSNPVESSQIENTNAGENEASICSQEVRLHWWQWEKHTPNPCPTATPPAATSTPSPATTTQAPSLTITVTPALIGGGGSGALKVQIDSPAPDAGATISLTSDNPLLAIDAPSITIAKGALSADGIQVHASSTSGPTPVTITGRYGNTKATFSLLINPPVSVSQRAVVAGDSVTVDVTLPDVATAARTVSLSASNTSVTLDQPTATIAPGSNTASFSFTVGTVTSLTQTTIAASLDGHAIGGATVTVSPPTSTSPSVP
jgi:hypothetical protein